MMRWCGGGGGRCGGCVAVKNIISPKTTFLGNIIIICCWTIRLFVHWGRYLRIIKSPLDQKYEISGKNMGKYPQISPQSDPWKFSFGFGWICSGLSLFTETSLTNHLDTCIYKKSVSENQLSAANIYLLVAEIYAGKFANLTTSNSLVCWCECQASCLVTGFTAYCTSLCALLCGNNNTKNITSINTDFIIDPRALVVLAAVLVNILWCSCKHCESIKISRILIWSRLSQVDSWRRKCWCLRPPLCRLIGINRADQWSRHKGWLSEDGPVWVRTGRSEWGRPGVSEDGPVWVRTGRCEWGRASVSEDGPVWVRTGRCEWGQASVSEDRPVWVRTGRCEWGRPGVSEDGPVWVRTARCEWGRAGVSEDGPVWVRTDRCEWGRTGVSEDGPVWVRTARCEWGRPGVSEDGPVWVRTARCERGRPGVSEDGPVWVRTGQCEWGRPGVSEDGPVWARTARCEWGRPGVSEDGPVWVRTARCEWGRPGVSEDGPVWVRTARCEWGRPSMSEDGPMWVRTAWWGRPGYKTGSQWSVFPVPYT